MSKKNITREDVLNALKPKVHEFQQEDQSTLYFKELSAGQRTEVVAKYKAADASEFTGQQRINAEFLTMVLCDANGASLFTPDDTPLLLGNSALKGDALLLAALEANGMAVKSVEDARGNSEASLEE